MYCECKFNPVTDIMAVEPFGFVNLIEAVDNGCVPSFVSNTEDNYNDIEDPSTILGKPRDVFEAYRMSDYIKNNGSVPETTEE